MAHWLEKAIKNQPLDEKNNFFNFFTLFFAHIKKKYYLCSRFRKFVAELKARSSAVGSAPRSGRGGRAFESPLSDYFQMS